MTMQSKNYQLYVFDWDGTVMDTTGLIARGMQQACVTLGYPQPDLDACRETIGLPLPSRLPEWRLDSDTSSSTSF